MTTSRLGLRILGGVLFLGGSAAVAQTPSVEDLLKIRPKNNSVAYATPLESEYSNCKVEVIKGEGNGSGYLLRDAHNQPLRRFFDTNGDRYIDVWSYFQDGKEVYREIDSNFNRKADQFRWMGQAGMKHGLDNDEDGRIDQWKAISPEEVSQELLQAVITRDFERLKALQINDDDIKTLQLPNSEAARIREKLAQTRDKFQKTAAALTALGEKTQWMHLETGAPQCIPADAIGGPIDMIRYKSGTILYANEGKHDFLQTGEMILVGRAWKLVTGPTAGYATADEETPRRNDGSETIEVNAKTQPLLNKLREVDEKGASATDAASAVRYNLDRAAVLEQLAAVCEKEADKENWLKQQADCLSSAAQGQPSKDNIAYSKLIELRDRIVKNGTPKLAGYVTFREMSAEYAIKLSGPAGVNAKTQAEWRERLKKFWETYPSADDAPDALLQLGMVSEFTGLETEAKNWYETLAKQFPQSKMAKKARGAIRRLDSEGQAFELAGNQLGSGKPFDIKQLQGRPVVVYYWASWNGQCLNDFAKIKAIQNVLGSKSIELVCVNLDNNQADAVNFLSKNVVTGHHLFDAGALDSGLAESYGVMVLPNMFLIGKDGKVVSRTVQAAGLEEEIKKLDK
jgi:thiol-disulfide isomerase/thioredoxin